MKVQSTLNYSSDLISYYKLFKHLFIFFPLSTSYDWNNLTYIDMFFLLQEICKTVFCKAIMTDLAVVITLCFIYFIGYLYALIMQTFCLY